MDPLRATSPDGREWQVTIHRVRLPSWPHSGYDPWDDAHDLVSGVFAFLVLAPLFWFVLPLARVLVELPVALARSFSRTRWVEAVCRSPAEITIAWRTRREHAEAVARHVARQLTHGYDGLTPEDAELVAMTAPVGVDDLAS
jgi:hypothetical protein